MRVRVICVEKNMPLHVSLLLLLPNLGYSSNPVLVCLFISNPPTLSVHVILYMVGGFYPYGTCETVALDCFWLGFLRMLSHLCIITL